MTESDARMRQLGPRQMQKGRNLQQRIREQNQKWQDQEESDGCVDECNVERTIPGRDVIHNEYHIGVY